MASQTYQYAGQLIKPTCDEDWVPFEPIIKELYKSMTLKDLMVSMKFQYAFQATLDQYKHRLAKWNVDNKRIKGDEYRAMLKKTKLRSLEDPPKQTEFWLHGQRVNPDNIARFEKRAKAQGKISDEDTFSDIIERAGPLLDPVGFLPMLTELVRNLGLWELVILIAPASSYWIKVIPTDDDDAKCIGDIGIYLLEALIRLGEINEASMILSSTILQYYSHISIYTTYLPCIHLLRAIQKHRDVFWNITLMLSSEEEILTQDYRWLDDVWNCELRFTYAWIVYQVQRSSDVMIALTKDDVTCVCIDDTVKDGYRMIGDVLDEEQEDEEAEDGDGDAIMLVV
ncbi:hypothetical protein BX600DRAFT_511887 [Xylariales sp. PMI_506]|nr:hypothetical protein BX600DRAFT_511887 [Xylariales sp. PMI_506]